eukprot:1399743-Pyramimonas_sp.AAC.1
MELLISLAEPDTAQELAPVEQLHTPSPKKPAAHDHVETTLKMHPPEQITFKLASSRQANKAKRSESENKDADDGMAIPMKRRKKGGQK